PGPDEVSAPYVWPGSTGTPRWSRYQAARAFGSRAFRNTPPIPTTRSMATSLWLMGKVRETPRGVEVSRRGLTSFGFPSTFRPPVHRFRPVAGGQMFATGRKETPATGLMSITRQLFGSLSIHSQVFTIP